jgi:hypothetical protein
MNIKYQYNEAILRETVKKSKNMAHLLSLYGIIPAGGNYTTMYRQLKHFNIDTSHWGNGKTRQGWLKGKTHNWSPKIPLSEIMIKNSEYSSTKHLKDRLFKEKIFEKKCYKCNLTEWLSQPIPTELEHINGDRFDCRKENLTILCPNCHAQTETYRGKNKIGSGGGSRTPKDSEF